MLLHKEQLENLSDEIWKGAISLRSNFKVLEVSAISLPMIILRRVECVLEKHREELKAFFGILT